MTMRPFAMTLALMLPLVLTASSFAQSSDRGRIYRLLPASDAVEGCFAPCLCPISLQEDMRGRFRLTRSGEDPLFTNYRVTEATIAVSSLNRVYNGAGTYRIGGEVAIADQMMLELSLNGADPTPFESELSIKTARWPIIDVSLSRNHLFCHDTLLHIVAAPIADWNGDGQKSVQDLFSFLGDYFAGSGDVDGNDSTSVEDIFTFLGEYFAAD